MGDPSLLATSYDGRGADERKADELETRTAEQPGYTPGSLTELLAQ